MEITTVTNQAKKEIAELCNKGILVEYDVILNFPRAIDHLVNYEGISDEQLIQNVDTLGSDSVRHHTLLQNLVRQLGYEPTWQISVSPRVPDVEDCLEKQLDKEKLALETYRNAMKIAQKNQKKVKVGGFFHSFNKKDDISEDGILTADEIINVLSRIIMEEERHIRLVKDSIATLDMHMSRKDNSKLSLN